MGRALNRRATRAAHFNGVVQLALGVDLQTPVDAGILALEGTLQKLHLVFNDDTMLQPPASFARDYHDANALAAQLHAENTRRQQRGLPERPIDERLLAAHRHGLPECAGVALGVDRLLALKLGADNLVETISFGWDSA